MWTSEGSSALDDGGGGAACRVWVCGCPQGRWTKEGAEAMGEKSMPGEQIHTEQQARDAEREKESSGDWESRVRRGWGYLEIWEAELELSA